MRLGWRGKWYQSDCKCALDGEGCGINLSVSAPWMKRKVVINLSVSALDGEGSGINLSVSVPWMERDVVSI